jgi:hypothetical protein
MHSVEWLTMAMTDSHARHIGAWAHARENFFIFSPITDCEMPRRFMARQ